MNPEIRFRCTPEEHAEISAYVKAKGLGWKCKARNNGADPPQDCEWPTCGCDSYADK